MYKKWNAGFYVGGYWFSNFSIFIFKVNHILMKGKDNPVEKVIIDEEELDGIEIEDILNLENLPRQCSSIKHVGSWKQSLTEESLLEMSRKKGRHFTNL